MSAPMPPIRKTPRRRRSATISGSRRRRGATIPAEIVYATSFKNDRLPRHYALGAIYDASKRADPLARRQRPARGGDGAGLQAGFRPLRRLCELRPDDPAAGRFEAVRPVDLRRRLSLDERAARARTIRSSSASSSSARCPAATATRSAFAVNEKRYSSAFVDNILVQRIPAGGSPFSQSARAGDVRAELRLRAEQRSPFDTEPAIRAQPRQGSEPTRTTNIPNAFVIGGRITADLSAVIPQSLFR